MDKHFKKGFDHGRKVFEKLKESPKGTRMEVSKGLPFRFYDGLAESRITFQSKFGIYVHWDVKGDGGLILTKLK